MQISLLLMEEIAKLFAIMLMGYVVVKAGLMKSSESKSISVVMVSSCNTCFNIVVSIRNKTCTRTAAAHARSSPFFTSGV